jgi:assimilatory nitrate reductase catalytic subunit
MYFSTETAQLADLVLPAAGWGEKEGTFINSERRVGVHKKVARAPGLALSDFSIFKLIAEAWGCGSMFRQWTDPEAVFHILKRLSAGQPCDMSGMPDYQSIDLSGGLQWPYPAGFAGTTAARRLFEDGRFYHADGKARFCFEAPRPMPEPPTARYPFLLLTGRGSASQWHTQTRTNKSAVLRKLNAAGVYVEIHPDDANALAIKPGQMVRVSTQRGSLEAKAVLAPTIQPKQIFVPMHYAATNLLTDAVFDPYSGQPAYKACAARLDCPVSGVDREI